MKRIALIASVLLLAGCALPPRGGDTVHARVVIQVWEDLYLKVRSGDHNERQSNPGRYQDISDAIKDGVTLIDIREGRLLLLSCRYGSNSGEHFGLLLPAGIKLDISPRTEIELVAGISSRPGHSGTSSKFVRVLPHRAQGRTNCDPAANS